MIEARYKLLTLGAVAVLCRPATASGTDVTLHLSGNGQVSRTVVQYQCDAKAAAAGLPAGPFSVEYINAGANSLVVVPVAGSSLVFANVTSGSGARYAAGQYIWWEAGGGVNFTSDPLSGHTESACHKVAAP